MTTHKHSLGGSLAVVVCYGWNWNNQAINKRYDVSLSHSEDDYSKIIMEV